MYRNSEKPKSEILFRLVDVDRQPLICYQPGDHAELVQASVKTRKMRNKRRSHKIHESENVSDEVSDQEENCEKKKLAMIEASTQTGPSNQVKDSGDGNYEDNCCCCGCCCKCGFKLRKSCCKKKRNYKKAKKNRKEKKENKAKEKKDKKDKKIETNGEKMQ